MNSPPCIEHPCRVLYIEDSDLDVELLEECLRLNHIDVDLVHRADAQEVLDDFANLMRTRDGEPPINLILLDLSLCGISGIDFLKRSQALRRQHPVPVVVLTGSDNPRDREESLHFGACDFATKPWGLDQYRDWVGDTLRQHLHAACPDWNDHGGDPPLT